MYIYILYALLVFNAIFQEEASTSMQKKLPNSLLSNDVFNEKKCIIICSKLSINIRSNSFL